MGDKLVKYRVALVFPIALISVLSGCASSPKQASSQPAAQTPPAKSSDTVPASGSGAGGELEIYKKGNVAPFAIHMGTANNWGDMLSESGGNHGVLKVEPGQVSDANDAMKVTWNGTGQFFAQSKSTADRKSYLKSDGALVFDMVIHEPPKGSSVTARVDCKYPCAGAVEVGSHFKSLPVGQKVTVKVPLACFDAAGTDFGNVNTPFLIFTSSRFVASFANVRWVPGAGKDADVVKCRRK